MSVKVRFAPSPTGHLHVGNIRAALLTWLFARKNEGVYLLRIDDTDNERSKEEYVEGIKKDMTWLGLDWDEFARQSERWDRYNEVIQKLKDDGRLYPCYETEEELALKRKSLLGRNLPPIYDRSSLDLTDEQKQAFEDKGRQPHWRFKLEHTPIEWNDHVRGEVKFHGKDLSDPVLIREDGTPLYHICSVIDDIDFNITNVIRGEDHVSNTATHVQMFEAIGAKVPEFAHYSLLGSKDGGKLSKRLGALSIAQLRDEMHLEAMSVNSLIAKLGTSDNVDAYMSLKDLIDSFDFSKFSRTIAKFDPDELVRLNAKIVHATKFSDVENRIKELGIDDMDEKFWVAVRENLETLDDVKVWWQVAKGPIQPEIEDPEFLEQASKLLPANDWDLSTWDTWVNEIKANTDKKGKGLFMPLRKALTGMSHGPELKGLLPLIGEDKAKQRLAGKVA